MTSGNRDYSYLDELLYDAQNGDKQAFGTLYHRLVDEIYRYIYFKSHDSSLAHDITADTFTKVLGNLLQIKPGNIRAYIYAVARNLYIDHIRHNQHEIKTNNIDIIEDKLQTVTNDDKFDIELVNNAMSLLPEHYGEIIQLRFIEGYSIKETAIILKRSTGAIRILQHRAMIKLKKILKV